MSMESLWKLPCTQLTRPSVRWVQKEARPVSLRQLTYYGRTLTESRLITSANYVRTELPIRYHLGVVLAA